MSQGPPFRLFNLPQASRRRRPRKAPTRRATVERIASVTASKNLAVTPRKGYTDRRVPCVLTDWAFERRGTGCAGPSDDHGLEGDPMSILFLDRRSAGHALGLALERYRGASTLVLGLPRGGVVVAAE